MITTYYAFGRSEHEQKAINGRDVEPSEIQWLYHNNQIFRAIKDTSPAGSVFAIAFDDRDDLNAYALRHPNLFIARRVLLDELVGHERPLVYVLSAKRMAEKMGQIIDRMKFENDSLLSSIITAENSLRSILGDEASDAQTTRMPSASEKQ